MASATDIAEKKIYEPESIQEEPLPDAVIWETIVDAPTSVAELNPTDGASLAGAAQTADLGDLAFEDLVNTLQIADAAITNAKIAVDAIQGDVIAAAAITETKISDNSISSGKIQAAAIVAGKIAANAIVASNIQAGQIDATKMNVSQLSAITANLGTVNAGNINGLTITGGTIRSASSGTRVEISGSTNEINIYSGSTRRARGYQQGWDWYNPSGTQIGQIYVDSSNNMLIAADLYSGGNLYYGVGSSGSHAFHVGTSGSTNRMYIDDSQMWLGDSGDYSFSIQAFGKLKLNNGLYMDRAGYVLSGSIGGGTNCYGMSVSHSSTGIYTVSHGLGTSSYTVIITLRNSSADRFAVLSGHTSSSFTVRIGNAAGSLVDADFDFAIFLWN